MYYLHKKFFLPLIFFIFFCVIPICPAQETVAPAMNDFSGDQQYKDDLQFFVEVYKTMQKNYYKPVDPIKLKKFIYLFNTNLYPRMKAERKSTKYIKWRSSAYLVEDLKQDEDIFSKLFPPKDAQKYESAALGKRMDLGVSGEITDRGFRVTWVEPRSDAYEKGLRENDVIYQIDGKKITGLTQEEANALLTPLADKTVVLRYFEHITGKKRKISVVSKEYFKQFSFMTPTGVDGIFCIKIEHFNRKTAEDVSKFMEKVLAYPGKAGLIIDLRGNPGGPPLAAQEISSFFLNPGQEFAYFQLRNHPKAVLDVPDLPEKYHYRGPIIILINEKTGSASELFSGVLQRKGRAILMGQNSAGQVFLKSMFYLSDNSMVLLVTARGHKPDGSVFSFSGLDPDVPVDSQRDDLVHYAAQYLKEKLQQTANAE